MYAVRDVYLAEKDGEERASSENSEINMINTRPVRSSPLSNSNPKHMK